MTADISQVTEISTRNESSNSMLGEHSQNEVERYKFQAQSPEAMEASSRNESSESLPGERSRCKIKSNDNVWQSSLTTENSSTRNEAPGTSLRRNEAPGTSLRRKTEAMKYKSLEPLNESADSSFGVAAQ